MLPHMAAGGREAESTLRKLPLRF